MQVNTNKLKEEIVKYYKTIDDYNNCMNNLYNVFEQSSLYWKDGTSAFFFDDIQKEKIAVFVTKDELEDIYKIYNYLIDEYSSFGGKIKFDLKKLNNIKYKFNDLIDAFDGALEHFNALNLGFNPIEKHEIINQKQIILRTKNNLVTLKNNIINTYEKITKIENEILKRLSKIEVLMIKETDKNYFDINYINKDIDIIILDAPQIEKTIEKVYLYVRDYAIIISEIKSIMSNINHYYVTDNTSKLSFICDDCYENLEKVGINCTNSISVYEQLLDVYSNVKNETIEEFKKLESNAYDIVNKSGDDS
ncbi:MAG: hypothetical protein IKE75_05750 [Bacilli bacterium]|nr:hypothetical protein [Bacilli bacterium]